MERNNYSLDVKEIDLKELFKIIAKYKWSILFISFFTLLLAAFFLYFKASVYNSTAVIEVKSDAKKGMTAGDFLGSAFSSFSTEKVDKEIEILRTFHVNNLALNKLDFKIRYFIDKGFKKIEIYDNIPLKVVNPIILDKEFAGKPVKLIPQKDGFRLEIKNSLKEKILHFLFDTKLIKLNGQKIYAYGKPVKTKYFELKIEKNLK